MRLAVAASLVLLVAVVMTGRTATADGDEDLTAFHAAGLLYEDGYFAEAASSYESLVGLGYEDPTLFYNLANAHYRNGDVGRAVLNYTRAQVLAPFDPDIETNLLLARERVVDPVSLTIEPTVLGRYAEGLPWVTADAAAAIALVLWLVAGLVAVSWTSMARVRELAISKWIVVGLTVALLATGTLALGKQISRQHWSETAVVTRESTDVFSAPGPRHSSRFSLSAGNVVKVTESRTGWLRITVPGTVVEGWVASADAESVLDRRS